MQVAGGFLGAAIGAADQRQPQHRQAQQAAHGVAAAQMAQLMAEVEAHAVRVGLHRVHHARQQHHEAVAQELRRERVQQAAALQHIGLGQLAAQAELLAAVDELAVQVGELLGAELHRIAAHTRHQRGLREQIADKRDQQHEQHASERAGDQRQPHQHAQYQQHRTQRPLARMHPILHCIPPL